MIGAIGWRGVIYGAADGLLLSVFPILAVFTAFRDSRLRRRLLGTVAVGALALVVSLGMTASYHLGYSDFRSQEVTKTLVGDAVRRRSLLSYGVAGKARCRSCGRRP